MVGTGWRVYHVHVENMDTFFDVTTYNMFGNEIKTEVYRTDASVRRFITQCKEVEPQCTSNWRVE